MESGVKDRPDTLKRLKFNKRGRRRNFASLTIHPVTSALLDDSVTQRVLLLGEKRESQFCDSTGWPRLRCRIWATTRSASANLAKNDSHVEECNTLHNEASKERKVTGLHPSEQPQTVSQLTLEALPRRFPAKSASSSL